VTQTPTAPVTARSDAPAEWYRNEELWDGFSGMMFSDKRAAVAARTVEQSPLFQFDAGSRVLDLCCGPGVYLVPLAQRGFHVTGVDLSPAMVAEARRRCAASAARAEIIEGDMLHFVRPGAFDVVVNMFSSFGYFEDDADNDQVLANVFTSLRSGGRLLIEVFGKEFLASHDLARPQVVDLDGQTVFVRNAVHRDWSRLRTEWTKIRGPEVSHAHIDSKLYSATELKALLHRAGFADVRCFGGFDARAYDLASKTLVACATKP